MGSDAGGGLMPDALGLAGLAGAAGDTDRVGAGVGPGVAGGHPGAGLGVGGGGDGVGLGVALGDDEGTGVGDGVGVAVGLGPGVPPGQGVAVGDGEGDAEGEGEGVGDDAGVGAGVGVGVAVGAGVGVAVGAAVGVSVGPGVGVVAAVATVSEHTTDNGTAIASAISERRLGIDAVLIDWRGACRVPFHPALSPSLNVRWTPSVRLRGRSMTATASPNHGGACYAAKISRMQTLHWRRNAQTGTTFVRIRGFVTQWQQSRQQPGCSVRTVRFGTACPCEFARRMGRAGNKVTGASDRPAMVSSRNV